MTLANWVSFISTLCWAFSGKTSSVADHEVLEFRILFNNDIENLMRCPLMPLSSSRHRFTPFYTFATHLLSNSASPSSSEATGLPRGNPDCTTFPLYFLLNSSKIFLFFKKKSSSKSEILHSKFTKKKTLVSSL